SLIANMDKDLGKELQKTLKNLGMEFFLSHKVTGATANENSVTVSAENSKGEKAEFTADYCLVAVGRKPYTENLGLENIGVTLDSASSGRKIPVNENLETSAKGIYAIGDV